MKCSIAPVASHLKGLCFFLSLTAAKVHDSQAYRNMEMSRERISFTFDPRDLFYLFLFEYILLDENDDFEQTDFTADFIFMDCK